MDSSGTRQGAVAGFYASVMNVRFLYSRIPGPWNQQFLKKVSLPCTQFAACYRAVGAKLKLNMTSLLKHNSLAQAAATHRVLQPYLTRAATHTHTHTHTLSLSHTFSLSLSLSHTHKYPKRPCQTGETHRLNTKFCTEAVLFTYCLHRNSSLYYINL